MTSKTTFKNLSEEETHKWFLAGNYHKKECKKCKYTMYAKVSDHKCNKCGGVISTIQQEEKSN